MHIAPFKGRQGPPLLWNVFFQRSFVEVESEVNDFRIWAVASHEADLNVYESINAVECSQRQK